RESRGGFGAPVYAISRPPATRTSLRGAPSVSVGGQYACAFLAGAESANCRGPGFFRGAGSATTLPGSTSILAAPSWAQKFNPTGGALAPNTGTAGSVVKMLFGLLLATSDV